MFYIELIAFFVGLFALVAAVLAGLLGWCGPNWSLRLGNLAVVLSLVALLVKMGASSQNVWTEQLDIWSCVLGISGAFWGIIGDVVCRVARSGNWNEEMRKVINQ